MEIALSSRSMVSHFSVLGLFFGVGVGWSFGTWRLLLNKKLKVWWLLNFSRHQTSNHTIHACHHHLNTSLIHLCIRIGIQFLCTIVLTPPPYFTSYHSAILHHFAVNMWKCCSGSELKFPRWRTMRTHA